MAGGQLPNAHSAGSVFSSGLLASGTHSCQDLLCPSDEWQEDAAGGTPTIATPCRASDMRISQCAGVPAHASMSHHCCHQAHVLRLSGSNAAVTMSNGHEGVLVHAQLSIEHATYAL